MRDGGGFHDSPKPTTQTGGAGGNGKPPRRGAGPFKPMGDSPDPVDKAAWKRYWKERQDALPYDFKGDWLESHEVESYERLARAGEALDYYPRRSSVPTNDFFWTRFTVPTEMKSTKAKYETIRLRIHASVRDARKQDVTKDVFLIDIKGESLTDELRERLSRYNIDRERYQIVRLFVMHGDGSEIEEIALKSK